MFLFAVFVVLWVWFLQDFHTKKTKNAVGTVAEMARRATGYICVYIFPKLCLHVGVLTYLL